MIIKAQKLNSTLRDYFFLLGLLSKKRILQIIILFALSILSAICEALNIGTLIPFLGILSNLENNIDKLGVFGFLFTYLPLI